MFRRRSDDEKRLEAASANVEAQAVDPDAKFAKL